MLVKSQDEKPKVKTFEELWDRIQAGMWRRGDCDPNSFWGPKGW